MIPGLVTAFVSSFPGVRKGVQVLGSKTSDWVTRKYDW
jgi:hypothetical protein